MASNIMYLIIGRSGSGKDTLAGMIRKKYHKKVLKSYTDRPKRYSSEDTHIFLDKPELEYIKGRICETEINGYTYFATKIQIETNDVYVIDPIGFHTLVQAVPNKKFEIIYLTTDYGTRKQRAINRSNDDYDARDSSESWQFTQFEKDLENNYLDYPNVNKIHVIANNGTIQDLELQLDKIFG